MPSQFLSPLLKLALGLSLSREGITWMFTTQVSLSQQQCLSGKLEPSSLFLGECPKTILPLRVLHLFRTNFSSMMLFRMKQIQSLSMRIQRFHFSIHDTDHTLG